MNRLSLIILSVLSLLTIGCPVYLNLCHPFDDSESSTHLQIETYLAGMNQSTHPSVIETPGRWNGWRYWMAYTPYPFANGREENPSIAVSNDLKTWHIPQGLYNPIANNNETACDELKDPHILYNDSLDRLEVWYLGRKDSTIASGSDLLLFRKTSENGIAWSDYEIMDTVTGTLSHSVDYHNGTYRAWAIKPSSDGTPGKLLLKQSIDGRHWNEATACLFGSTNSIEQIWHGAVSRDSIYRFTFIPNSGNSAEVLYSESRDGVKWTTPSAIISKGNARHNFYRPCILAANDSLYCFYGVVSRLNEWHIAMSAGRTPGSMQASASTPPPPFYKDLIISSLRQVKQTISSTFASIWAGWALLLALSACFVSPLYKYRLWAPIWLMAVILQPRFGFSGEWYTVVVRWTVYGYATLILYLAAQRARQLLNSGGKAVGR